MSDTLRAWHPVTRRVKTVARHASLAQCGYCGRVWDNSVSTSATPAPAGRCPFEGMRRLPAQYWQTL